MDPEPPAHKHIYDWIWQRTLGDSSGEVVSQPRSTVAPRVDKCVLLFNPVYKLIFIKNTKVAGSSVYESLGSYCPPTITLEAARVSKTMAPA